jgi:hypothetical protein
LQIAFFPAAVGFVGETGNVLSPLGFARNTGGSIAASFQNDPQLDWIIEYTGTKKPK